MNNITDRQNSVVLQLVTSFFFVASNAFIREDVGINFELKPIKMKKVIFVLSALAFSVAAFAQSDTVVNKTQPIPIDSVQQDMSKVDGCMMMDGKMIMIKDSVSTPMKKQMIMGNGTKVMMDGMCMKRNGEKMKMKEGDHMDMHGTMHHKEPTVKSGS